MLRLAQESDGVIVTNDNLRDLLDESHVWRDIIKKRCRITVVFASAQASLNSLFLLYGK